MSDRGGQGRRTGWLWPILIAALFGAVALSVTFGARGVGWGDIWRGLAGHTGTIAEAAVAQRVPRTVLAALAGAALAVSGLLMQAITRNPLADPGLFGVNSGAALAVVLGLAWFGIGSAFGIISLAVIGAAVTAVFVWMIGSVGLGGPTPLKLALAGAATAIAISSVTMAIVLPRADIAEAVQAWHIGGVGGATWARLAVFAPVMGLALLAAWPLGAGLNALALGDDAAAALGTDVVRIRLTAALVAVTLAGATTAICGPIGFVGLVVPHMCRLMVGIDLRRLIPCTALAGAAFLIFSDVLGRLVAAPSEAEVGIVTALFGAPFFIWIVRRQRGRGL